MSDCLRAVPQSNNLGFRISIPTCIICAPTATRTRDLLLRRHFRSMPGRCWVWPDVPFDRSGNGWRWPGAALCLWSLAPRLAPRDLVSSANVRMPGSRFGHQILSGARPQPSARPHLLLGMAPAVWLPEGARRRPPGAQVVGDGEFADDRGGGGGPDRRGGGHRQLKA